MANICVFCGTELSLLNRKTLYCCSAYQPACKDCYARLSTLPQEEQGRQALASGRAVAPDVIRSFLNQRESEAFAKREKQLTDKTCLRCGGTMLKLGRQQFQLGEHSFFMGDLNHLIAGSLTLDLLFCEQCRKAEFFLPEDIDGPSGSG